MVFKFADCRCFFDNDNDNNNNSIGFPGHFHKNSTQIHAHALVFKGFSEHCHSRGSFKISDVQFHFIKTALKFTLTRPHSRDFLSRVIPVVLFKFQTFNFIYGHGNFYVCHSN